MSHEDPKEEPVTAMVLLRPASGRPITGASRITAQTLGEYAPDPADVETVGAALAREGFEVGPMVGVAISVTAPRRRFEEVFGTPVAAAQDGGWQTVGTDGAGTREIPYGRLPEEVAARVQAVTFEPPAETTPDDASWP